MSNRAFLTPAEGIELQKLYEELPVATARAIEALQTGSQPFEGALLARFLEADAEVGRIYRRISKLIDG